MLAQRRHRHLPTPKYSALKLQHQSQLVQHLRPDPGRQVFKTNSNIPGFSTSLTSLRPKFNTQQIFKSERRRQSCSAAYFQKAGSGFWRLMFKTGVVKQVIQPIRECIKSFNGVRETDTMLKQSSWRTPRSPEPKACPAHLSCCCCT